MKIYTFFQNHKVYLALLTITFSLSYNNKTTAQYNNSISITPIKAISQKCNVHYERLITKKWIGVLDIQIWYKNRKGDSFLERRKENSRLVNKGVRYTLGIKKYFSNYKDLKREQYQYVGLNAFIGKHHIEKREYNNTGSVFGFRVHKLSAEGEKDIISKGVNIDIGIRNIYRKKFLLDFGLQIGKSWAQPKPFLLQNVDPDKAPTEATFIKKIHGFYLEPHLSVGILF